MGRLAGKVALISGGTTGIGLACAQLFAREGALVVVAGRDEAAGAAAMATAIRGDGAISYERADVADPADCARIVAATVATHGALHIVVANAAVGTRTVGGTVESIPPDLWDLAYQTNVGGVVELCRAALPHLRAAGGGSVLLTSSVSALVGGHARPTHAYAATKGALLALTRAMAVSYGPEQIRVNALIPGLIRTRLTSDLLDDPAKAERAVAGIPLGFAGEPDDIAYAALYLASDEARFVTGAALVIDGGATVA
jgi:NAD(P)-dependent dehydrogenase (short-subunit alcohol dehydrogenase family)